MNDKKEQKVFYIPPECAEIKIQLESVMISASVGDPDYPGETFKPITW